MGLDSKQIKTIEEMELSVRFSMRPTPKDGSEIHVCEAIDKPTKKVFASAQGCDQDDAFWKCIETAKSSQRPLTTSQAKFQESADKKIAELQAEIAAKDAELQALKADAPRSARAKAVPA